MKIIDLKASTNNAYKSIQNSMNNVVEISVSNSLDACGCTGNGSC